MYFGHALFATRAIFPVPAVRALRLRSAFSDAALFDEYGYGHGNANTVDLIDPDKVVGTGIDDPVGAFARGAFTSALPPAKNARLFQLWFEAQAGLD